MKSIEISLGHAAMHSPWLVQAPNPSASICATMSTTRASRSGWPWGRSPRCDTFAATNSMAEALGHAATQAPQPMPAAASTVRTAVDHHAAHPADPLAAVVVERDRLVLAREQLLVEHVQHLEERHVGTHVRHRIAHEGTRESRPALPPDVECEVHYL